MGRDIHQARVGDIIKTPDGREGRMTGAGREKGGRYMLSVKFPDGSRGSYEHLGCDLTY